MDGQSDNGWFSKDTTEVDGKLLPDMTKHTHRVERAATVVGRAQEERREAQINQLPAAGKLGNHAEPERLPGLL